MAKKGLLGSGSKGRMNNPKVKAAGGGPQVGLNPSQNRPFGGQTDADQRTAQAVRGRMEKDQLKKNKSGSSPL